MAPSRKKGSGSSKAAVLRREWNVGELVLAKVKGYPPWPAQINKAEDHGWGPNPNKIFVLFFGTKQVRFCHFSEILPFTPRERSVLLAKLQQKNCPSDLSRAIREICKMDDEHKVASGLDDESEPVAEEPFGSLSDQEDKLEGKDTESTDEKKDEMLIRESASPQGDEYISQESLKDDASTDFPGTSSPVPENNAEVGARCEGESIELKVIEGFEQITRDLKVSLDGPKEVRARIPERFYQKKSRKILKEDAKVKEEAKEGTSHEDILGIKSKDSADLTEDAKLTEDVFKGQKKSRKILKEDAKVKEEAKEGTSNEDVLDMKSKFTANLAEDVKLTEDDFKGQQDATLSEDMKEDSKGKEDLQVKEDLKFRDEGKLQQTPSTPKSPEVGSHPRRAAFGEAMKKISQSGEKKSTPIQGEEKNGFRGKSTHGILSRLKKRKKHPETDAKQSPVTGAGGSKVEEDAADMFAGEVVGPKKKRGLKQVKANTSNKSMKKVKVTEDESPGHKSEAGKATDASDLKNTKPSANSKSTKKIKVTEWESSGHKSEPEKAPLESLKECVVSDNVEKGVSLPPKAAKYRKRSTLVDAAGPKEEDGDKLSVAEKGGQKKKRGHKQTKSNVVPKSTKKVKVAEGESPGHKSEPEKSLDVPVKESVVSDNKEKGTSLPPKAAKYRIRSSLPDDEAVLPPSKRWHRAFEAMSACAAEAATENSADTLEKKSKGASSTEVGTSNGVGSEAKVEGFVSATKSRQDVPDNKLRQAVEAAKETKQKFLQKEGDSSASSMSLKYLIAAAQAKRQQARPISNAVDLDKGSSGLATSPPVPGRVSSGLSSPSQMVSSLAHSEAPKSGGHPSEFASADVSTSKGEPVRAYGWSTGDDRTYVQPAITMGGVAVESTEAAIARDTFTGMLETLSRAKDSIGRASRHAIECSKHGIADQVVDVIVQKLENEPSFHRRVDLFFLVDSITQCSYNQKGVAGAAYLPIVQAALPRLLSAAAPPGSIARENRRQCLKVLNLWLERNILPETVLRHFMTEIESHNIEDKGISGSTRRPSRSERAVDDPLREMEGMFVDEYGSNASFALPGLLIPRMYEDDEEESDEGKEYEISNPVIASEDPEEKVGSRGSKDVGSEEVVKHRHVLEDVDGELEMEDASPSSENEHKSRKEASLSRSASTLSNSVPVSSQPRMVSVDTEPPRPASPPPPPSGPPPSPPPLPASPPPSPPPLPPLPIGQGSLATVAPPPFPRGNVSANVSKYCSGVLPLRDQDHPRPPGFHSPPPPPPPPLPPPLQSPQSFQNEPSSVSIAPAQYPRNSVLPSLPRYGPNVQPLLREQDQPRSTGFSGFTQPPSSSNHAAAVSSYGPSSFVPPPGPSQVSVRPNAPTSGPPISFSKPRAHVLQSPPISQTNHMPHSTHMQQHPPHMPQKGQVHQKSHIPQNSSHLALNTPPSAPPVPLGNLNFTQGPFMQSHKPPYQLGMRDEGGPHRQTQSDSLPSPALPGDKEKISPHVRRNILEDQLRKRQSDSATERSADQTDARQMSVSGVGFLPAEGPPNVEKLGTGNQYAGGTGNYLMPDQMYRMRQHQGPSYSPGMAGMQAPLPYGTQFGQRGNMGRRLQPFQQQFNGVMSGAPPTVAPVPPSPAQMQMPAFRPGGHTQAQWRPPN